MRYVSYALVAVSLLVPFSAPAQDQPGFSGTWKMDASRSESAHQAVPIGPVVLIIKQTPNELSIETRRQESGKAAVTTETLSYTLDGAEHTAKSSSGTPIKSKAHWDGVKLVTETEREIQDSTVTTLYVLSMNAAGKELTIDKTLTIQHGYQGPGAKNTGTGKDVYVRTAPK